eukprot:1483215-Pleurochrysis_carterae.AAC.1
MHRRGKVCGMLAILAVLLDATRTLRNPGVGSSADFARLGLAALASACMYGYMFVSIVMDTKYFHLRQTTLPSTFTSMQAVQSVIAALRGRSSY